MNTNIINFFLISSLILVNTNCIETFKNKVLPNQFGGSNEELYQKLVNFNDLCSNSPCLPQSEATMFKQLNQPIGYGTISKEGINNIIDFYKKKSTNHTNLRFTDLGCGEGISLAIAALFNNSMFSKIDGVELSQYRTDIAHTKIDELPDEYKNKIHITQGSMFDYNINDSNIIFISNLLFPDKVQKQLCNKLNNELQPNSFVFVSSNKYFDETNLQSVGQIIAPMSWDKSSVLYVYKT